MQYMLLCSVDETLWNNLPQAEQDAVMKEGHDGPAEQSLDGDRMFWGGFKEGVRL